MKITDNDLFRLQDGEPPQVINPDWDIETVIVSMASELLELRAEVAHLANLLQFEFSGNQIW